MAMVEESVRGFTSPGRYIQGPGEMNRLREYTSDFGLDVFVLIDGLLYESIFRTLKKTFDKTSSRLTTEKFNGEITLNEIERVKETAEVKKANVIVGIGGGKTLDTAKAVAEQLGLPVIIAPTSAATDAPCTLMSIIYKEDGLFSHAIFCKKSPDLVLVDTEIVAKAPVRLLVSGMGDAMSTYFEARANAESDTANYVGKGYRRCRAGMAIAKLCYDILLEDGLEAKLAAEKGVCTEALENVIEANTLLSGVGAVNTGCAAAHAICNGFNVLPETHKYYHGEKVALGTICMLVLENRPKEEIETVTNFFMSVGLPVTLKDLDIEATPEKVMEVAQRASEKGESVHSEPFKITAKIIYNAIIAADSLGNYYKGRHH